MKMFGPASLDGLLFATMLDEPALKLPDSLPGGRRRRSPMPEEADAILTARLASIARQLGRRARVRN